MHRIQLLLDQASSKERHGDRNSATSLLEEAFRGSALDCDFGNMLEALIRMAFLYHQGQELDLAADYWTLALELSLIHDDPRRAARALNGLGIYEHRRGNLQEAELNYQGARELASSAGDAVIAGDVQTNLGIVANVRGDLKEALILHQSALELYENSGELLRSARALNNLGMVHTDRGEHTEASACLNRALNVSRSIGDLATEGIVQTNLTELLLQLGDLESARSSCDQAYEIASSLNDPVVKADALKFFGIIYRRTRKPHLAETHLRQAIELSLRSTNPFHEAEAQRELALVLREQDRNADALAALNRAHALFTGLQAKEYQADIRKHVIQLEEDFLSLVRRWGESIEAKDRYTRGHCQRVADYACSIAEKAGVAASEMVWFRMGAFLHDVGKTEIPGEILNKPGRLTDQERTIIESHAIHGFNLLAGIPFPWDVRPMVRSHHERWDGQGYPDGLSGTEIPLTARILRIADVFDALTTTRSYREPLTFDQALELMEQDLGSFDPALFATFRQVLPDWSCSKSQSNTNCEPA